MGSFRKGARVVAHADAAHTPHGRIVELSGYAPVALVRFECGCCAYVPLRRLELDKSPTPPAEDRPRPKPADPPGERATRAPGTRELVGARAAGDALPRPGITKTARAHTAGREERPGGRPAAPPAPPPAPKAPEAPAVRATPKARTPRTRKSRPRGPRPTWGNAFRTYWTPERCRMAARAWYEARGSSPTGTEWTNVGNADHPSRNTVLALWPSWEAFIADAGLPAAVVIDRRRSSWSDEAILEALRRDARRLGRTPKRAEWFTPSPDHPSPWLVKDRFGSWNDAIRRAGLVPRPPGKPRRNAA